VDVPIAVVKQRFEKLQLKGVPVEVLETAPAAVLERLHSVLERIDDSYDQSIRALSKFKTAMPVLYDLYHKHTRDTTYMMEFTRCQDEDCPLGCKAMWEGISPKLKAKLLQKVPLPTRDPEDTDQFFQYAEACKLESTSEKDLPSKTSSIAKAHADEVAKQKKAIDKQKVESKVIGWKPSQVCPEPARAHSPPPTRTARPPALPAETRARDAAGALDRRLRVRQAAVHLLEAGAEEGAAREARGVHRQHVVRVRRRALRAGAAGAAGGRCVVVERRRRAADGRRRRRGGAARRLLHQGACVVRRPGGHDVLHEQQVRGRVRGVRQRRRGVAAHETAVAGRVRRLLSTCLLASPPAPPSRSTQPHHRAT
jgi:hypothetical protein